MQVSPQITFRNMEASPSIETQINGRIEELEQFFGRIIGCKVMIEEQHRHHHQGRLFHVRVEVTVPGKTIVANRHSPLHHAHEDAHVAIRDAFDAVRRQLEDHARRSNGRIKAHEEASVGRIVRLMPEEGYGFLVAPDGQEIYLHRNAVVGDGFARLAVGDEVRYVVHEGEGEHGAQASTVVPTGKRHSAPAA